MKNNTILKLKKGLVAITAMALMAGSFTLTAVASDMTAVSEQASDASLISKTKATNIALKHAGLKSGKVSFTKRTKSLDDGRWEWEIEFYEKTTKNKYDYDIDAYTGDIKSFEMDSFRPVSTGKKITLAKAKSIARTNAGLNSVQVSFTRAKLVWDDGTHEYDLHFTDKSKNRYEYEINAYTGVITSYKMEDYKKTMTSTSGEISKEKAKEIVLEHAGLIGKTVKGYKIKTDYEHGRKVYEIEFDYRDSEYEYEVDVLTGEILDFDIDYD